MDSFKHRYHIILIQYIIHKKFTFVYILHRAMNFRYYLTTTIMQTRN